MPSRISLLPLPAFPRLSLPHIMPSLILSCAIPWLSYFPMISGLFQKYSDYLWSLQAAGRPGVHMLLDHTHNPHTWHAYGCIGRKTYNTKIHI